MFTPEELQGAFDLAKMRARAFGPEEKTMYYIIPDCNRPGKQRLVTNRSRYLGDYITCLVGPFTNEDEAREEARAIEIARKNRLPELDADFFKREGEWFESRFVLTEAEYADLVENQEAW